jgi:uncharacterized membrane protein YcaP (DUF421 family)
MLILAGIPSPAWTYAIEWLQYHVPCIERLIREPKLKLIDGGKLLRRNMRATSSSTNARRRNS